MSRRLAVLMVVVGACAGGAEVEVSEVEVSAELDGKADAQTELAVRAGETTLWVHKAIALRSGESGPELVLRGRTSRTLTEGRGFIFDDVYGEFTQRSPRVFELTWPLSTARSLVDGVDQFIGLSFVHSSTRPDQLTARAVVRPRLHSFTGSSKIYLVAELAPVVVAGRVVYRMSGRTYGANEGVRFVVDHVDMADVARDGSERFSIDLEPHYALSLVQANAEIQIIADFATGGVDKRVRLGLSLKKLGMTSGDAEAAWPPVGCTPAVRACLQALPSDALDLAGCGTAVTVNACAGQVGVVVDDTSFQHALHAADARLATVSVRADATGLVGADRTDAFLHGALQTVEAELERMFGRWFLSATTRAAQLALATERGIDAAYARPLDLVEPALPQPGNPTAMRQVAADAVLAELARMDLLHSELARTLEQLTREFRAQHVADLKAFRESIDPESYMTTKDAYLGRWLGLYTEVVIDRASGNVESTLVEID